MLTASPYTEQYTISPLYDNEDSVGGILYSGTPYYFRKNLQGDIIAVEDGDGATIARYTYDAWGRVFEVTAYNTAPSGEASNYTANLAVANANPYRYRGYYYDAETELYYLQSRYYDPKVGRFVNVDEPSFINFELKILNLSLFSYCKNTPPSSHDPSGYFDGAIINQPQSIDFASILTTLVPILVVAKTAIITAIKAILPMLWNIFIVIGLIVLLIAVVAAVSYAAEKIIAYVNTTVEDGGLENKNGYAVYVLTREMENPKTIFYVGRTKNFNNRMKAHANKRPFYGYVVILCTTERSSKAAEQAVLAACIARTVFTMDTKRVNTGSNKIRGIAKQLVGEFKNDLKDLSSLLTSTRESDLLCLMEGWS